MTATRAYRALVKRAIGPTGGSLFHLIRDDAEASLCGLPRALLMGGGMFDELVCEECIEWLPKRQQFSAEHPKAGKE